MGRGIVGLICALAACMGVGGGAAQAAAPPSRDPFYSVPTGLDGTPPGTVLRTRAVSTLADAAAASTHQILYRTTDQAGRPTATVATVLTPRSPAPGPRKIVSYHVAEDSLTRDCAPSYALSGQSRSPIIGVDVAYVSAYLAQGWDVVVPDYEGPESAFGAPLLEGRAALDGIRAVQALAPTGLEGATSPAAVVGYSGGSIPTVWAGILAPTYAPELNLRAIVAGGVVADPAHSLARLDGGLYFGAILTLLAGLDRVYPELRADDLFNAAGRRELDATRKDAGGCGGAVLGYPGGTAKQYTNYPTTTAMLAEPRVAATLGQLDMSRAAPPRSPMLVYNEIGDDVLFVESVDQMVAAYCAKGATVRYVRGPAGDHATGLAAYFPHALAYLRDRFAGKAAPSDCPPPRAASAPATGGTCPVRAVSIHARVPKGFAVRRIVARIGGRVVARRTGRGALRVSLAGHRGTVRVTLTITGARRTIIDRRIYRVCVPRT